MGLPSSLHNHKRNKTFLRVFLILVLSSIPGTTNLSSNHSLTKISVLPYSDLSDTRSTLEALNLKGYLSFNKIQNAAKDFGNQYHLLPLAVLYPRSVSDISTTVNQIFNMGPTSNLMVAARGHGHSLQGQAQAHQGVVINMESLQGHGMKVYRGKHPYVDVSGGELWINVLHETLKHGLAPKSWTDYLHLTIGGTLSNAGISGQTFRHGPQISNVYRLEVVTGRGEVVTCSKTQNADLFHGVLGGLGQFGIITRARISLEPARKKVKWIRVLYSNFSVFSRDQELLMSMNNTFDYIEGFVIINRTRLLDNWRSSFNPNDSIQASQFTSEGKILFCLEVAKYFDPQEADLMNQQTERLLSELSYIPSTLFSSNLSYVEFLNRVHISEIKLREKGLWEVPHPWLNLFIPKSRVFKFVEGVFSNIVTSNANGPILIYPVNQTKWNNKTSLVTPDEEILYAVSFLSSAVPSSKETDGLDYLRKRNERILDFCVKAQLNVKQYLPHYQTQKEWKAHFGNRWETFVRRKSAYDPLAILAPGHRIFRKATPFSPV